MKKYAGTRKYRGVGGVSSTPPLNKAKLPKRKRKTTILERFSLFIIFILITYIICQPHFNKQSLQSLQSLYTNVKNYTTKFLKEKAIYE